MAMERLQQQVTAVTDELNLVRAEIVQLKSAHATMHQSDVETRAPIWQSIRRCGQPNA